MPRGGSQKGLLPLSGYPVGLPLGLLPGITLSIFFPGYDLKKDLQYPRSWTCHRRSGRPEAANNHSQQFYTPHGLGIPTSPPWLFSCSLMLYGLTPGPRLFQLINLVWTVIGSMYVGNVMLLVLNLPWSGSGHASANLTSIGPHSCHLRRGAYSLEIPCSISDCLGTASWVYYEKGRGTCCPLYSGFILAHAGTCATSSFHGGVAIFFIVLFYWIHCRTIVITSYRSRTLGMLPRENRKINEWSDSMPGRPAWANGSKLANEAFRPKGRTSGKLISLS